MRSDEAKPRVFAIALGENGSWHPVRGQLASDPRKASKSSSSSLTELLCEWWTSEGRSDAASAGSDHPIEVSFPEEGTVDHVDFGCASFQGIDASG